jgi:tRNA (guanine37-N1)-methyltransferase
LQIDIVTIFPGVFAGPLDESIVGRARQQGLVTINLVDLREFTDDRRRTVDDKPYGGGPGMLMKPEPLFRAVESLRQENSTVVLMTPQGERLTQKMARELAAMPHLILIAGHYEGVDERVRTALVDREVSIGDYILTSGNLPTMVMVDAVTRLLPGALGCDESNVEESFRDGLLEYPQYTRPEEYRGMRVPEVLRSGDHGEISRWRRQEAERRTRERRPDLWKDYQAAATRREFSEEEF